MRDGTSGENPNTEKEEEPKGLGRKNLGRAPCPRRRRLRRRRQHVRVRVVAWLRRRRWSRLSSRCPRSIAVDSYASPPVATADECRRRRRRRKHRTWLHGGGAVATAANTGRLPFERARDGSSSGNTVVNGSRFSYSTVRVVCARPPFVRVRSIVRQYANTPRAIIVNPISRVTAFLDYCAVRVCDVRSPVVRLRRVQNINVSRFKSCPCFVWFKYLFFFSSETVRFHVSGRLAIDLFHEFSHDTDTDVDAAFVRVLPSTRK